MFSANGSQVSSAATYIEDVFSTYLFTGKGGSNTITNGIDLSTKGGAVWTKSRNNAWHHEMYDTARGTGKEIYPSSTAAEWSSSSLTAFNANGFTLGVDCTSNTSGSSAVSWTFRKQPKFFDVVTWTGDGVSTGRQIAHSLGSAPGCILVKQLDSASAWQIYHRSLGSTQYLAFTTAAAVTHDGRWYNTDPTSTNFTVGIVNNASGSTYVAYIFAHDAGGFGLTGTDNVISCGSFTSDSGGNATVNLGYEPQFVMFKRSSGTGNWITLDTMRGWINGEGVGDSQLNPNTSNAESSGSAFGYPTATGFQAIEPFGSSTYIYIAIRRGPMKVPTDATKVYNAASNTGDDTSKQISAGFPTDLFIAKSSSNSIASWVGDRLRGDGKYSTTTSTVAEDTSSVLNGGFTQGQNGVNVWNNSWINSSPYTYINYFFRRAPSFFDVVCYTGTGVGMTVNHNLGVAPELIICKSRSAVNNWWTVTANSYSSYFTLESTGPVSSGFALFGTPTSTQFFPANGSGVVQNSGEKYVTYLFATCPGVSKVGAYTGTGTTKQVDCGFTAGARFVLIKRTDAAGAWYVWDTARGIVAGNDPYLLLNSTAAEVTSTDYIDTYSAGFELSSTAPAALNASGGTYIFLAIA